MGGWSLHLLQVHDRLAPRFARPEPRHLALLYLQGIVSEIPRKNGWQLAEQAGESRPDGMQRLLSNAVWDENGVRDELRTYVLTHLSDPYAARARSLQIYGDKGYPCTDRFYDAQNVVRCS